MYYKQSRHGFRRIILILASVSGLCVAAGVSAQQTPRPSSGTPHAHHVGASVASRDTSQAALRAAAKISEDSARKTALANVRHGTVLSSELEREHGRLIYSFDIRVTGKSGIDEVNVDAMTGAVIAHVHETSTQEHQEAKHEAAQHHS